MQDKDSFLPERLPQNNQANHIIVWIPASGRKPDLKSSLKSEWKEEVRLNKTVFHFYS